MLERAPKIKFWVYPIVWLDAIHFKVKEEGRVVSKAVYCILAVNQQGSKDLLGMYLGDSESSSFWLNRPPAKWLEQIQKVKEGLKFLSFL